MITADIFAAINRVYLNSTALQTLLPGGIHSSSPKQLTTRPYAVITIKDMGEEYTAGYRKIGTYIVTIKTYATTNMDGVDQLGDKLSLAFDFNTTLQLPGSRVLSCLPIREEITKPEESPVGCDEIIYEVDYRMKINEYQVKHFSPGLRYKPFF